MELVVGGNYVIMVPFHIIVVIFMGLGGTKRWGDALKSLFGGWGWGGTMTMQDTSGDNFYVEGGFALCNTTVYEVLL